LVFQLNLGNIVHLAPGDSATVNEIDISGNEKVAKMRRSGLLAIEEVAEAEGSRKKPDKKAGKGTD
jgi:hypothetical protein